MGKETEEKVAGNERERETKKEKDDNKAIKENEK